MSGTTNITKIKRGQLLSALDEFCTFYWGGESAWDKFGAFIINDQKGSLKFYNGPGFSNEYTKPQFDAAGGTLQGVNFNKQTIDFKIGVYWISIEDYRKLMNWLNPMRIDYLVFGFDLMYRYDVKLSKIGDSTRWIIGRENGEPRYYTELSLTFEIQGAPCAKGTHPYEFNISSGVQNTTIGIAATETRTLKTKDNEGKALSDFIASDLETPVKVTFEIKPSVDSIDNKCKFETNTLVLAEGEEFKWDDENNALVLDQRYAVCDNNVLSLYSTLDYLPIKYLVSLDAQYKYDEGTETKTQTINLLTTTLQNLTLFTKTGERQQQIRVFANQDEVNQNGDKLKVGDVIEVDGELNFVTEIEECIDSDEGDLFYIVRCKLVGVFESQEEANEAARVSVLNAGDVVSINNKIKAIQSIREEYKVSNSKIEQMFVVSYRDIIDLETNEAVNLTFTYNSETGLIFLKTSDDTPSLLTLSTYADTNDFLVENLTINKFMLPGNFQYEGFYNNTVEFVLSVQKQRYEIDEWVSYAPVEGVIGSVDIECFPRTNII